MARKLLKSGKSADEKLAEQATEIEQLKVENHLLIAKHEASVERSDFVEELITELAMVVYQ